MARVSFATFPTSQHLPFDLTQFSVAAAESCGRGLTAAVSGERTLEAAARAACTYLYEQFADTERTRECVLVRAYKTHDFGALPPDIQRVARRAYGTMAFSPPEPELKCLILLATVGDEPAWNDRRTSKNHQAIPLPSREIVENAPMIAQLIRELGLDLAQVIQPSQGLVRELAGKSYGVFHVSEALGSPYIPAQDFVRQHNVRSVVGFGGALPNGELMTMILFSRVPISVDAADRFRALAFDLNDRLAGFDRQKIFDVAAS